MTLSPINAMAQTEYALYGGALGCNPNCPSYVNGYMANRNAFTSAMLANSYQNGFSPNFMGGVGNNTTNTYGNNITSQGIGSARTAAASQPNGIATQEELDTIGKYYLKGLSPSETVLGAAFGGAAFEIINNFRFISNPWNTFTTLGKVEKTFADVRKKGTEMYKLWRNPDTHNIMKDAYARMHKLEGGAKSRIGLMKSRIDETTYNALKKEMELALRSGDKEAIATATERIRVATNAKTGLLPRAWASIKNVFTGNSKVANVAEKLGETDKISQAVTKNMTEKYASKSLAKHLIHDFKGQAGFGGVFMAGLEFLMDWGKISAAFSKDSETGWTQVGQTSVKAAGSIAGWAAGSAVGSWAGAKLGALAGTAICPGVGTLIGAVAGAAGGMIGCNLMGKLTHKILGDDVGSKVELAQMKSTPQGQTQLLALTMAQAQNDKKLDPRVAAALNNVAMRSSNLG